MPQILEESPYNDDTLAEGGLRLSRAWEDWTSARQGLLKVDDARLLSRILHNLPNVAAIDAVLSNLDLNLDEQTDLEKATRVVLEGWDEWGPGFGGKESTMLHALQKIHTWAAWKLNERLVED
jgi:hypothetical protein